MNLELDGKVALVTGSTKGIGYSIANVLHSEGCRLVLNGRSASLLSSSAQKLDRVTGIQGDVSRVSDAQKVVNHVLSEYGKLIY